MTRARVSRTPSSTYRLQLHGGVTLADAAQIVPYLADLGVDTLYLSPILVAPPGAAHGYHIVDPTRVDPALGGEEALERLRHALDEHGFGLLLDIVPNHLAARPENPWWEEVVRDGPAAQHAHVFDIDWEAGGGRVILPGEGEVNYRRFFDIGDLVGVRVEDPRVFEAIHAKVLELVERGIVTGLRIDHVDGLRDPAGYLETLDRAISAAAGGERYVVVEKILEGDEPLPRSWPVAGTTGYEFLAAANAALVSTSGLADLDRLYRDFTGFSVSTPDVLHAAKIAVLEGSFAGEVAGLARRIEALAERVDGGAPRPEALRAAIVALTASFPVYRTYIRDEVVAPEDRHRVAETFVEVQRRHPDLDPAAVRLLERLLAVDLPVGLDAELRDDWLEIILRWQQLTGPAMAKGFEDTTLYRVNRLLSLNEVGVDAEGVDHPGGVGTFHERIARRAAAWPRAISTTSTHDTKRSEDVRARIAVLSEVPGAWEEAVRSWHGRTAYARERLPDGRTAPDRDDEWRLYQTLVGMWPLDEVDEADVAERLGAFALKAAREAGVNTSWLEPDEAYEAALGRFVTALVGDAGVRAELKHLLEHVALPGVCNALAQVTWKLLAPGVADLYQGCELWDWSLVDPDNRRPVDFARRVRLLGELDALVTEDRLAALREIRDTWWDGRVKLFVTRELLALRRRHPELLRDGSYRPLATDGEHAHRVIAFAREREGEWVAAVTPRLVAGLAAAGRWATGDVWGDTTLEAPAARGTVSELLTGREVRIEDGRVRVADVLARLPVAALVRA